MIAGVLTTGNQQQQKYEERGNRRRARAPDKIAAVEAIGGVAGDQEKNNAGEELGQAYQAQIEWALGDFVDLPAYRYGLHLLRYHYQHARGLVVDKIWIGEGCASGGLGGGFWFGHALLL